MARRAKWMEWANYTHKSRANVLRLAKAGNKDAQKMLMDVTKNIRSAANYRLSKLEEYGVDYGGVYNDATDYTQIVTGTNRFPTPKMLDYDYTKMFEASEVGLKFLRREMSHWQKMVKQQEYRIQALQKHTVLPEDFTRSDEERFLRFLGNEEVSSTIEEYGRSDLIVDIIYEETQQKGDKQFGIIQLALTEFLSGSKGFVEAMKDAGIPIEDYFRREAERKNIHNK